MAVAGQFKKSFLFLLLCVLFLSACAAGQEYGAGKEGPVVLKKVDVVDNDKNTTVVITTGAPVTFTTLRQQDPPKLIVDLAGVEPGEGGGRLNVDKGPVSYISSYKAENAKRITRVEIALTTDAESIITQNESSINVILSKTEKHVFPGTVSPEAKAPEAPPAPEKKVAESRVLRPAAPSEKPAIKPAAPSEKAALCGVASSSPKASCPPMPDAQTLTHISLFKEDGIAGVRLVGDGVFKKPQIFKLGANRLVVDLIGMNSTKPKETLDVSGKVLQKVRMAAHRELPRKVRIVLDVKGPYDYDVKNAGRTLIVSVYPPVLAKKAPAPVATHAAPAAPPAAPTLQAKAEAPKAAPVPVAPAPEREAKKEAPAPTAPRQVKPRPSEAASTPPVNIYVSRAEGKTILSSKPIAARAPVDHDLMEVQNRKYTGGKISFDVQDADLDKVIKLLADVAGLNLIMDPTDVKGKVTLKLDNVPWDQALDILLRIYNLDKRIDGNVLRVASKAKLDDETRRDLLQVAEQKKLEQQAEDLYTMTFKINYMKATELEPKIKKILSPRGEIISNESTNELVVTDIRRDLDKAGDLIKILDKEVKQVMIEARIVTVDVGYSRSLGVSWALTKQSGNNPDIGALGGYGATGTTTATKGVLGIGGAGGTSPNYSINIPKELAAAAGGGAGSFFFGHLIKGVNLDLTIQALEAINKLETLAAPKIMTLENKPASIVQGTTLYVQTTSAAGTAPAPLNANLSLTVTPRVTGDDFIAMDIVATDNTPSTITPAGATASIETKSVNTSVIVKDGDTIVLGGVFTKTNDHSVSEVPILGKIPLLGWLFKNQIVNQPQSELLVFITPKLVKPVVAL
jgi:type IV pilus secretin PilQ/predicted competence protein